MCSRMTEYVHLPCFLRSLTLRAATLVLFCLCCFSVVTAGNRKTPSVEVLKHHRMGEQYYDLGLKDRAMTEMRKGLKIAEQKNDKPGEALMLTSIYKVSFYEKHDNNENSNLLLHALDIYRSLRDTAGIVNVYNNLALNQASLGNRRKAVEYYQEALKISGGNKLKRAIVLQNMSDLYMDEGDMGASVRLLKESSLLFRIAGRQKHTPDDFRAKFLTFAKLAQAEFALNNRHSSVRFADSAQLLLPQIERVRRPDALAHLSHIRLMLGDSIAAFRLMLSYEALMDSLTGENNNSSLQSLLVQFDTERLQQHNEALRLKVQNRNIAVISGIVIAILLLFLSIFLVRKMKSDRCRSRLIQQQQRDIVRYQKEASELRERELRHEMDAQNRQLTSYAINHSAINEFHSSLISELENCAENLSKTKNKEAALSLKKSADKCRRFDMETLSSDFRVYFEKVHPDFFNRLKEQFPLLTKNDLRLCAFLYLGMSTKEIAALIYREVRSVESSRLRLRKKLGIGADVSLQDFLISIVQS